MWRSRDIEWCLRLWVVHVCWLMDLAVLQLWSRITATSMEATGPRRKLWGPRTRSRLSVWWSVWVQITLGHCSSWQTSLQKQQFSPLKVPQKHAEPLEYASTFDFEQAIIESLLLHKTEQPYVHGFDLVVCYTIKFFFFLRQEIYVCNNRSQQRDIFPLKLWQMLCDLFLLSL